MGNDKGIKFDEMYNQEEDNKPVAIKRSHEPQFKSEHKSPKIKKHKGSSPEWKKIAAIVGAVLAVALIGWSVYSSIELSKMQDPDYASQHAQEEVEVLVQKVGKLMELPEGEPVIATVSDKSKLTDQPFFAKAENGDKVLIFADSSIAIIYRGSNDKIINSGPIAITADTSEDGSATEGVQQ